MTIELRGVPNLYLNKLKQSFVILPLNYFFSLYVVDLCLIFHIILAQFYIFKHEII